MERVLVDQKTGKPVKKLELRSHDVGCSVSRLADSV